MRDQIACHLPLDLSAWERDEARLLAVSSSATPASLPHPEPTKAFWTHGTPDCNPLAKEGSEGPLTSDVDICIIGSGVTGVSCAYHLARLRASGGAAEPSLSVAILDARDFCPSYPFFDGVNSRF